MKDASIGVVIISMFICFWSCSALHFSQALYFTLHHSFGILIYFDFVKVLSQLLFAHDAKLSIHFHSRGVFGNSELTTEHQVSMHLSLHHFVAEKLPSAVLSLEFSFVWCSFFDRAVNILSCASFEMAFRLARVISQNINLQKLL